MRGRVRARHRARLQFCGARHTRWSPAALLTTARKVPNTTDGWGLLGDRCSIRVARYLPCVRREAGPGQRKERSCRDQQKQPPTAIRERLPNEDCDHRQEEQRDHHTEGLAPGNYATRHAEDSALDGAEQARPGPRISRQGCNNPKVLLDLIAGMAPAPHGLQHYADKPDRCNQHQSQVVLGHATRLEQAAPRAGMGPGAKSRPTWHRCSNRQQGRGHPELAGECRRLCCFRGFGLRGDRIDVHVGARHCPRWSRPKLSQVSLSVGLARHATSPAPRSSRPRSTPVDDLHPRRCERATQESARPRSVQSSPPSGDSSSGC